MSVAAVTPRRWKKPPLIKSAWLRWTLAIGAAVYLALVFQTTYGKAFYDQEFDAAFVFMQYIGYLRRNPDQEGYDFWLGKLKRYGNWVDAQLVLAFIISPEYRARFSP